MQSALQTRLLRVVQDGEFVRLSGSRPIKTDVRIISSTNRDRLARLGISLHPDG